MECEKEREREHDSRSVRGGAKVSGSELSPA